MEWIVQNWFVVALGLVALVFLFGKKSKRSQEGTSHVEGLGVDSGEKTHKRGGCGH